MRNKFATVFIAALLLMSLAGQSSADQKSKDAAQEANKGAEAFREIMDIPEKAIPETVLKAAECVAVFPSTIKGGLIVGGQKGEGLVSCRTGTGWSGPVFLDMTGGSVGAQIGGQKTDYVFLFMNRNGIDGLLSNKLTLGAETSVAAGPVGREAGASTDWKLNAEILSYSRSKGLFAGVELKGVVISIDDSDMKNVYGKDANPRDLLAGTIPAPAVTQAFPVALSHYSSGKP
jgi:lipid-binding SYLF domain-containing protein